MKVCSNEVAFIPPINGEGFFHPHRCHSDKSILHKNKKSNFFLFASVMVIVFSNRLEFRSTAHICFTHIKQYICFIINKRTEQRVHKSLSHFTQNEAVDTKALCGMLFCVECTSLSCHCLFNRICLQTGNWRPNHFCPSAFIIWRTFIWRQPISCVCKKTSQCSCKLLLHSETCCTEYN